MWLVLLRTVVIADFCAQVPHRHYTAAYIIIDLQKDQNDLHWACAGFGRKPEWTIEDLYEGAVER